MSKKIIALSTILLSVLIVVISIESVTGIGVLEGQCTFYQTISPFGKYFNLSNNDNVHFKWIGIVVFIIGNLLLFIPNFLLFNQSKKRSVTLIIINIIGMIFEFLFFQSCLYMFMLITLCILLACNILVQFIHSFNNKIDISILILTIFIAALNCYYLYHHFTMNKILETWYLNDAFDKMIREMISISRINVICFVLWFIPYGILLTKEIMSSKK